MIRGIRSVALGVSHLANAADFFKDVWHLDRVAADNAAIWFRGTGPYHHILSLHAGPHPSILRIIFDVADRADVERLHAAITKAGTGAVEKPGEITAPGGGYGFGCQDPEGRNLAFVAEVADHADRGPLPDRVRKITHVNLNGGDKTDESFRFFTDVLGLRLVDESIFWFLRCQNPDHHSIVLGKANGPTLNHIAFEMPDLDSVMRGAGRMRDNGYPIEWGVGRHGPGNNVFAYFAGPEEIPIEYTAEVLQIDDSYEPNGPAYWKYPAGRSDRWGVTNPRSARLNRIQQLFQFDPTGYRITSQD
jgi:catechol 2,3-dioxygenase